MRPADGGAGRAAAHGPVPPPLAFLLPLVAVGILTLRADANLGLTSFAVTSDLSFPGLAIQDRAALVLADLFTVLIVVGIVVLIDVLGRPRRRGAVLLTLVATSLVALQAGVAVAESLTGVAVATDFYLARSLLLAGTMEAARTVLRALAEHRAITASLAAATGRGESLAASGRTALEQLRAQVFAEVRAVMQDAVDVLVVAGPERRSGGARLRTLAEDVLRPLSHRLAAAPVPGPDPQPEVVGSGWRDTLTEVARRPVIPARTLAVLATGLAFLRTLISDQDVVRDLAPDVTGPAASTGVAIALTVDWAPLAVSLGELALILGATWWGAARFSELLEDERGTSRPLAAWAGTVLALAAVAMLTLVGPLVLAALEGGVAAIGGAPVGPVTFLASFVPLLAVTLGVSVSGAIATGRVALEQELARRSAEVARTAARTQAVLAHEQRRLARTLHADVQAAVNAASLVLDRAAREDAVTGELVEDVSGRIAAAFERFLAAGASDRGLVDRLDDVRAVWAGVCDVRIDVTEEAATDVDDDAVARELLVDLVAEGCANAAVHGGASEVRVRITSGSGSGSGAVPGSGDGAAEVRLVITDDGSGPDASQRPERRAVGGRRGLGSEVLRASCIDYAFATGPTGSTLRATVPLG